MAIKQIIAPKSARREMVGEGESKVLAELNMLTPKINEIDKKITGTLGHNMLQAQDEIRKVKDKLANTAETNRVVRGKLFEEEEYSQLLNSLKESTQSQNRSKVMDRIDAILEKTKSAEKEITDKNKTADSAIKTLDVLAEDTRRRAYSPNGRDKMAEGEYARVGFKISSELKADDIERVRVDATAAGTLEKLCEEILQEFRLGNPAGKMWDNIKKLADGLDENTDFVDYTTRKAIPQPATRSVQQQRAAGVVLKGNATEKWVKDARSFIETFGYKDLVAKDEYLQAIVDKSQETDDKNEMKNKMSLTDAMALWKALMTEWSKRNQDLRGAPSESDVNAAVSLDDTKEISRRAQHALASYLANTEVHEELKKRKGFVSLHRELIALYDPESDIPTSHFLENDRKWNLHYSILKKHHSLLVKEQRDRQPKGGEVPPRAISEEKESGPSMPPPAPSEAKKS